MKALSKALSVGLLSILVAGDSPGGASPADAAPDARLGIADSSSSAGVASAAWLTVSGTFTNGAWQVKSKASSSNVVYILERSSDLLVWTSVAQAIAGSNQPMTLLDTNPPTRRGFYRVRATSAVTAPGAPSVTGSYSGGNSVTSWQALSAAAVPAFVQLQEAKATARSRRISTSSFNSPVTAGNLIVAWIWYNSASQSVSAVTDSKGNSYAKAVGPTTGSSALSGWRQELWYAKNVMGGSSFSVTATFSGAFNTQKAISAHEYSGVDGTSPLDATSVAVTSSANAATPAVPISAANELIFGTALMNNPVAAGAGFTPRSSLGGNVSEDKIATATGSYAATFSNPAQSGLLQMATFRAAGNAPDTTPPSVPANLSAVAVSSSQINLSWTASTDNVAVAGYVVYRSGTQLATLAGTSFSDTGLAPSTSYTYTVAAFDAAGNYSAQSLPVSAATQAAPVLVPVINSFGASPPAIAVGQTATLSWNVSGATSLTLDNGIGDVTGTTSRAVNPAATSTYTLTATDSSGSVTAQTTVTVSNSAVCTYTTSFPISENPLSEGGNWIDGKTAGLDWSDCATTNLNGRHYAYNLQPPWDGVDYPDPTALLTGDWGPTQSASGVIYCTNQTTGAYEEVELRLRSTLSNHWGTGYLINWSLRPDSSAYVQMGRWNGPFNNFSQLSGSGSGVSGAQYILHSGDTVSATITNNTVSAFINGVLVLQGTDTTGSPWTNGSPGLGFWMENTTANTDYGFTSFSATSWGPGSASADTVAPSTPSGLSATAVSSAQINLSWNASTDNVGVAGYKIYRGGAPVGISGSTAYSDAGLSPTTLYTYTVSAYDAAGNNSAQSAGASATTLAQAGRSWAHVQTSAGNSSAASNTQSFGSATTSGNLIIVEVDWYGGSGFTSVSDSQGNVFTQVGGEQYSATIGDKSRLYYAKNIKGGVDSITTVVAGSPMYHELYVHEYSGLSTTDPLDAFSGNVGTGNSFSSNPLTTTGTNELLYGVEIDSGIGTASAGWTTRSTFDSNVAADSNAPSAGPAAFTGTSAGAFIAWIAAFK